MTTLSSILAPTNLITATNTATLTNKTIDVNENTLLNAPYVEKTSDTGAAIMPVGTTAERPASPHTGGCPVP